MSETGTILTVKQSEKNPFLTHVLPLAVSDDLLMHSILALAGTHLSARLPFNVDVERSSLLHYGAMIEGVRDHMVLVQANDVSATIRLLLILIMLSHYQVCSSAQLFKAQD